MGAFDSPVVLSLLFPSPHFQESSKNSKERQRKPVLPAGEHRFFREVDLTGVSVGAWRLRSGGWENSEKLKIVHLARDLTAFCSQNDRIEQLGMTNKNDHCCFEHKPFCLENDHRCFENKPYFFEHKPSGFEHNPYCSEHKHRCYTNLHRCYAEDLHCGEGAVQRFGGRHRQAPDEPLCFEVKQLLVVSRAKYDSRCILRALNCALSAVSHIVRKRSQHTKALQIVGLKSWREQSYCIRMRRQYVVLFLVLTVEVRDA